MLGLSKIRLAEDSSCEGALELNLRAENIRNSWTFVQYVNLVVTWLKEWLSGEFRVIRGKVYISNFGSKHGFYVVF